MVLTARPRKRSSSRPTDRLERISSSVRQRRSPSSAARLVESTMSENITVARIRSALRPPTGAGEELLHLVDALARPLPNDSALAPRQLEVARTRDVLGEVPRVADVDEPVAGAMQDQRRHLDRRQHRAHVDLPFLRMSLAAVPGLAASRSSLANQRRRRGLSAELRRRPQGCASRRPTPGPVHGGAPRAPRAATPSRSRAPRTSAASPRRGSSAPGPLGMGGGEHGRHRAALELREHGRPLGPGGVHHGHDVVHLLLERGRREHWVRQSRPAAVEHDQPRERGHPVEVARDDRAPPSSARPGRSSSARTRGRCGPSPSTW